MIHETNPDIDVLYLGNEFLCSVPKGLGGKKGWSAIHDKREAGYETSDGIIHRSLSGIGIILLGRNLITSKQFVKHFTSPQNKEMISQAIKRGYRVRTKSGLII